MPFLSLLTGRFIGVLSGGCVVFAYVCLLVLMRVEGFCPYFIVELSFVTFAASSVWAVVRLIIRFFHQRGVLVGILYRKVYTETS